MERKNKNAGYDNSEASKERSQDMDISSSDELDLTYILAILINSKRDVIVSGIAGFLIAVMSVVLFPVSWDTVAVLSPANKVTLNPVIRCLSPHENSIQVSSGDLFDNYLLFLQGAVGRQDASYSHLEKRKDGRAELVLRSETPQLQLSTVKTLLSIGEKEQKDYLSATLTDCKADVVNTDFFQMPEAPRLERKGIRYSVRLMMGVLLGICFASFYVVIRHNFLTMRNKLVSNIERVKNEQEK